MNWKPAKRGVQRGVESGSPGRIPMAMLFQLTYLIYEPEYFHSINARCHARMNRLNNTEDFAVIWQRGEGGNDHHS